MLVVGWLQIPGRAHQNELWKRHRQVRRSAQLLAADSQLAPTVMGAKVLLSGAAEIASTAREHRDWNC